MQRRIQILLDVSERAEAWPDFAHRGDIERIECAKRIGSEVEHSGISTLRAIEFLITRKRRAGDDSCLELEQHYRARRCVEAGALVMPSAFRPARQIAKEDAPLHVLDAPATKTRPRGAHREDTD